MTSATGLRLGVTLLSADTTIRPDELARAAEERGFESLWLPEHSHIPASRESPWPGSLTGEPLPAAYARLHDAIVGLSMAAAVTTTLRLGTSVLLLAQRDAIWTAKQIATLDHLSGGRVELGVGFGWNREEMVNHGADFASRWGRVRETVSAMRSLWTNDLGTYEGDHVRIAPSWQWPKPAQPLGPPIHLGGGAGPRVLGEVAAWADGWLPISARSSLRSRLDLLSGACERAGRDPSTVVVSVFGATTTPEGLTTLADEGVHRAVLTSWSSDRDGVLRDLDAWAGLTTLFGS
jgi:probable F420-dependent oxidoreductase